MSTTPLIDAIDISFEEISSKENPAFENAKSKITALIPTELMDDTKFSIINSYDSFIVKLEQLKVAVEPFTKPSNNPEDWKQAKLNRNLVVKVRTNSERVKDALKKNNLITNRAIQDVFNYIEKEAKKIEAKLREVEETGERIEQEQLDKLQAEREAILTELGFDFTYVPLRTMDTEVFNQLVEQQKQKLAKEQEDAATREKLNAAFKSIGQMRYNIIFNLDPDSADAYSNDDSFIELGQLSEEDWESLQSDITAVRDRKIQEEKEAAIYQEKLTRMRIRAAEIQSLGVDPDLYDLLNMEESLYGELFNDVKKKAADAIATKKLEDLRSSRKAALLRFTDSIPLTLDLGLLEQQAFAEMLGKAEAEYNDKLQKAKEAEDAAKAPDKIKFQNECLKLSCLTNPPEFKSKYYKQLYFEFHKEIMPIIKKYEEKVK